MRHTDENPVWTTFDAFDTDLRSRGAEAAMGRLVASLAHHRAAISTEAWKRSCATLGAHPVLPRLLEDPYSRDARTKPCGYAGDARTLDYVYLRDPGAHPFTLTGRAIFDVATSTPIAAAVRDRSAVLAECLADRARHQPLRAASIACGHARELDRVPETIARRIQVWGVDQDARSIAHCRGRMNATWATLEIGSVRDILTGRIRIPPSDVVYASGLFDYLDLRIARALLKRMFAAVNAGGSVVVPNLSPHNEELGYMEAVMDWWMQYRTEADMSEMASALHLHPDCARTATFSTSCGRIAWLQLDRLK